MTMPTPDLSGITSRQDLAAYLLQLAQRVERGELRQENERSVDYVRAAAYWTRSMHGFFANQGKETPEQPDWALIAMIFSAAFVYE
ncbi:hypothetical protein [Streptomyces sp. NPDC127098]|uniref:DUF7660 family protein n=1 Tax=Streptomyces sp. NPDC127098 TaxID=3347137 RepID=UPI00364C3190